MTEALKKHRISIISILAALVVVAVAFILVAVNSTAEAEDSTASTSSPAAEGNAEENGDETAVPVEVMTLADGPIAAYISATANLVPEDLVTVLAEAEGRVTELKVDEGDSVVKNQVLAVLARDEAEIIYNKAELKASNAEIAYQRARDSQDQGLISTESYDTLEMEYRVARQEVREAQWRLDRTLILAPFSGRITERFITVGQHIRPGDQVLTVADFDPLVARVYLPERDVWTLKVGQEARVSLGSGGASLEGRIQKIAPMVDTATGTVKVTVEALEDSGKLRPGAFVTIDILKERRPAVVLLPRESVIRELGQAHVFVTEGKVAVKRIVELGLEEDGMVEAISGVTVGENVIVAGQGGIDDGQDIQILES